MNTILHSQRLKTQIKPSSIKAIMAFRRQRRSSTQQHQQSSPREEIKNFEDKFSSVLNQKPKDFTSIFAKHKRNEYSAYKSINLNKSAIIKLQQHHQQINKYQTSRQYEINLKNIAKLRKRHSLEPINYRQSQRNYKKVYMQTSRSIKRQTELLQQHLTSDQKCYRQLKQAFNDTIHHESNTQKIMINDLTNTISNGELENLSEIKNEEIELKYQSLPKMKKVVEISQIPSKLIAIHKIKYSASKKNSKIKLATSQKKKEEMLEKNLTNQVSEDIYGWSTQSFYPKNKAQFFNSLIKN